MLRMVKQSVSENYTISLVHLKLAFIGYVEEFHRVYVYACSRCSQCHVRPFLINACPRQIGHANIRIKS